MSQFTSNVVLFDGRKAKLKLHILIVGGGIAGLSAGFCLGQAGHHITIVESASAIKEVGAGIQVGPNMSRLLMRWGLSEPLKRYAVRPLSVSFRRYSNGERIGFSPFGDPMEFSHGAPYLNMHRADLINMLTEIAKPFVNIRLSCRVVAVDPQTVSATLESGEVVEADVIIGADGVKSTIRAAILRGVDNPLPTGDAVYRAVIPTLAMMEDPLLRTLILSPEVTCWMGPGKHIVGYCIRAKEQYNIVLLCPDDHLNSIADSWTAIGSVEKLRETFDGWEPRVEKILRLVRTATIGKLVVRKPLKIWLDTNSRITLIGDACHSMLPYRAQGSAMAVEDAAVLGNIFSRLSHRDQIAPFLEAYQNIRIGRTSATQAASWSNQKTFHLPDGPEQQKRDASMKSAMHDLIHGAIEQDNSGYGNANIWADRQKNMEQFSFDADEAVSSWWRSEEAIPLHMHFAKM